MLNNIQLNPFAISGLLVALTCFFLSIMVLVYGKTKLSKLYAMHTISVGIWGTGAFLIGMTNKYALSLILWKLAYSGVIFIPVFLLHAIFIYTQEISKGILLFAYLQGIIFLILNLSGLMGTKVHLMFGSFYYYTMNWMLVVSFLIWVCLVIYEHYKLIKYYKKIHKNQQRQFIYFLISIIIGFSGGVTNFFPAFKLNFYPYGNFLIPFYCVTFYISQ